MCHRLPLRHRDSRTPPGPPDKEIAFTSVTQYFDDLNASLEGSYRFYHDSYGVFAHTVGLTWHQWLVDKHLMVEPTFRFSEQSAASFYATSFSGPFSTNPGGYHSSDYRLSELYTMYFGAQVTVLVTDWVHLTAGYHRYGMYGLDGKTSSDMYPRPTSSTSVSRLYGDEQPNPTSEVLARVTQSARTTVENNLHSWSSAP